MVILERPFVSDFLYQTLAQSQIPVLDAGLASGHRDLNRISKDFFIRALEQNPAARIYSNSENALEFLWEHAEDHPASRLARLFKDKAETRRRLSVFFPDYYFKEYAFEELFQLNPDTLPYPLILKPSVGFFSLGVFPLFCARDYLNALTCIRNQKDSMPAFYPESVLSASRFLLEAMITGEELAVDAYFDSEGEPVILNLMHHIFSSETDVSDRLYLSSEPVFEAYYEPALSLLNRIGSVSGAKNFPVHLEFRLTSEGKAIPIEVNPLRFAGWCTADLSHYAYGINPYEFYFENRRPNWKEIFKTRKDWIYSLTVADLPHSLNREKILSIDEDGLLKNYTHPLQLRLTDYHHYPLLGFVFACTPKENPGELKAISCLDFSRYCRMEE